MDNVLFAETLSSRLRAGGALGGWCGFASFASVELMCQLGYDFLVFATGPKLAFEEVSAAPTAAGSPR